MVHHDVTGKGVSKVSRVTQHVSAATINEIDVFFLMINMCEKACHHERDKLCCSLLTDIGQQSFSHVMCTMCSVLLHRTSEGPGSQCGQSGSDPTTWPQAVLTGQNNIVYTSGIQDDMDSRVDNRACTNIKHHASENALFADYSQSDCAKLEHELDFSTSDSEALQL